jgi:hypothetical protein
MSTKTPAKTVHVFVSSTWLDLQPERAAVETALQRLRAQQREVQCQAEHLFQTLLPRRFRGNCKQSSISSAAI